MRRREGSGKDSRGDIIGAYAPYLIIIVVFGLAQWGPIKDLMAKGSTEFAWPGLDILNAKGEAPIGGHLQVQLAARGRHAAADLRPADDGGRCGSPPATRVRAYGRMLNQLKWATLTVAAVLGLAYVMNLCAQTLTIGNWIAGAGGVLAFLSPIIGWLGTAVTGSDTSSNSLFGVLQVSAAKEAGLDPTLLASGELLRRRAGQDDLAAEPRDRGGRRRPRRQEGDLFRKVIGWSLLLLLIMCVLVYLQSTAVLSWMVV